MVSRRFGNCGTSAINLKIIFDVGAAKQRIC
jgi:hypothetical protein